MRFKVSLHKKTPEGFVFVNGRPTDLTGDPQNPHIQSVYHISDDDITLYGLTGSIVAYLNTRYEKKGGLLGRKISDQEAYLSFAFSTTFDGYERTESQAGNVTIGTSLDPEKAATAFKIHKALKERFEALGYKCLISKQAYPPEIKIYCGDQHKDPIKEFSAIFKELKTIEAAYEDGKKPLGDIKEPRRAIKINPHHHQRAQTSGEPVGIETETEESGNKWRELMQQQMVQGVTDLAAKYFPVGGEPVTATQHQLFEKELRDFLSKGR